jgi:hypothetical protein
MQSLLTYVLITPARNESDYIEFTLKSVTDQTYRPLRWVIVSDGSTDGTDEIVRRYAAEHPWIELLRMPERKERHFAGKVLAFNAGLNRVQDLPYQVIGNLDGDLSFDREYFRFLVQKLTEDASLGLVGTPFREDGTTPVYDYRIVGLEHVSGCCQLFRRECFEGIGGYVPVKGGGIDHIAVLTARMKGWKTRTFTETACFHHRKIGTAGSNGLTLRFKTGEKDYLHGGHPLWEMLRAAYQMGKKPFLVGGLTLGAGYLWGMMRRLQRPITPEMVAFRRHEQMQRLRKLFGFGTTGIF